MKRVAKKFNRDAILRAYYDGEVAARAGKTPRPPKAGSPRRAYINGYNAGGRIRKGQLP